MTPPRGADTNYLVFRLAQAPDGTADVTPFLDIRFGKNLRFSFAVWRDNGSEAPASQVDVDDDVTIGVDDIRRILDKEAERSDPRWCMGFESSCFESAKILADSYKTIGLDDQASKLKHIAIQLAKQLVAENEDDHWPPKAIAYLLENAPDEFTNAYDQRAQQFAERGLSSFPNDPCCDFAYAYAKATKPDFDNLSESKQTQLILATLGDMNRRGMELLQSDRQAIQDESS